MSEQIIMLPAITLWQPWASLVADGFKTIETRMHQRFSCLEGKTIAIHAGLKYDDSWSGLMRFTPEDLVERCYPRGQILCTAFVSEHRPLNAFDSYDAMIDCSGSPTRYGLFLKDVLPIGGPIFCRGRQGIWTANIPASWFYAVDK